MLQRIANTIHFMDWSRSDVDVITRLMELKNTFSAVSLKVDCSWRFVETSDGQFDFSWPDRICKLCAQAQLKVWFILNSAWGMPDWVINGIGAEAFAWNSLNQTGRQGVSEGSLIGRYPAPVIPAYSNPWVLPRIANWQRAVVKYVEERYAQTVAGYIAEGEIYLNPDNDLGEGVFDYNPHTLALFRKWLSGNTSSPYFGASAPRISPQSGSPSCNTAWKSNTARWDDVLPPRKSSSGSLAWRDWGLFLRWYVAWSYQQITQALRQSTRKPISLLVNSFTGWPMPDDHVWGGHRTHNNAWSIYQAVAPYVDYLGLTAYQYDPGWEIDRSAQWSCNMAVLDACSQWLKKPAWIVEGGFIVRPRCLTDLRWQLYNAYVHGHPGVVFGYLDMASGQNANYSWNPALEFPVAPKLCQSYALRNALPSPSSQVAVIYNSLSELLAPGEGTEARAVRACVRWLRSLGVTCHVLDSIALEQGVVKLSSYKLAIMPCVHALSSDMKRVILRSDTPIFSDKNAGDSDEWLQTSKPIRPDGIIDSVALNAEQADLEDRAIEPVISPMWLREMSQYLDSPSSDPRISSYKGCDLVFNRDAQAAVRYRGQMVAPGSEFPELVARYPVNPLRLLPELILNRQPNGQRGPCAVNVQPQPNGEVVVTCDAYKGPTGYWQSAVYWNFPMGTLSQLRQYRIRFQVTPLGDSAPNASSDVELRLVSSSTGRFYVMKLPVETEQAVRTVSITELGIVGQIRCTEIDRIEVCFSGSNWPAIKVLLSKIQLYP